MLVFTRKKNESIVIFDNVIVTVVDIRGEKVRLGIDHPKEVPVHRNEVYEAIRRNRTRTTDDASPAQLRQRIEQLKLQVRELEAKLP